MYKVIQWFFLEENSQPSINPVSHRLFPHTEVIQTLLEKTAQPRRTIRKLCSHRHPQSHAHTFTSTLLSRSLPSPQHWEKKRRPSASESLSCQHRAPNWTSLTALLTSLSPSRGRQLFLSRTHGPSKACVPLLPHSIASVRPLPVAPICLTGFLSSAPKYTQSFPS